MGRECKGPLSVQQFTELQEPDRSYSKYGKLALRKKRRPQHDTPTMEHIPTPSILVKTSTSRRGTFMKVNSAAIRFWDKLCFEGCGGERRVEVWGVAPEGVAEEVRGWVREVCGAWEGCGFGEMGMGGGKGIVGVKLLPKRVNEDGDLRRFRSYEAALNNLVPMFTARLQQETQNLSTTPHPSRPSPTPTPHTPLIISF
ncbi:hypothetical protein BC829DRAFT_37237 [Chytridium lagenaria]|nr:hypothetical protein BC829DRAFT_37237 [Chytridium lagenaria]